MPADAAQARLAGVLDGAAELVDVAVALRVLRQLDRVGAAAGQVDELDRDVVCSGLVAHAGERLDLHVVDAHVDVADAEALQVGHGDRVRGEVLAAHVHLGGEGEGDRGLGLRALELHLPALVKVFGLCVW